MSHGRRPADRGARRRPCSHQRAPAAAAPPPPPPPPRACTPLSPFRRTTHVVPCTTHLSNAFADSNPAPEPPKPYPIERREKYKGEIDALARAKEELEIEYSLLIDKQKQAKAEKALLVEEIEALRGRFDKATVDYVRSLVPPPLLLPLL